MVTKSRPTSRILPSGSLFARDMDHRTPSMVEKVRYALPLRVRLRPETDKAQTSPIPPVI